jgi:hypothetical protein
MTEDQERLERLVWRIQNALRYYGNAEYDAGTQQGTDNHQRYLGEATRQLEYVESLIDKLAYNTLPDLKV